MDESPAGTPRRRAAAIFIFVTILLDMLALGMIMPIRLSDIVLDKSVC